MTKVGTNDDERGVRSQRNCTLGANAPRSSKQLLNALFQGFDGIRLDDVLGRLVFGNHHLARPEGIGHLLAALDRFRPPQLEPQQAGDRDDVAVFFQASLNQRAQ